LLAVTSFHPKGFELYGQEALRGLVANFPGKVVAYYEELPDALGVDLRPLDGVPKFSAYIERIKRHPGTDGNMTGEGYNFRYDCNRFCRKVFAQDAVFDEDEYVFWFDADTVVKKPVPEEFLLGLFKGRALVHLGRNTYTETGFVGFHTKHPDFQQFRENYLSWFLTGKIFSQLKGWHDCIAFDHARTGVSATNLSPGGRNYDEVMPGSVLAEYFDHLKGNRKHDPSRAPKVTWS